MIEIKREIDYCYNCDRGFNDFPAVYSWLGTKKGIYRHNARPELVYCAIHYQQILDAGEFEARDFQVLPDDNDY